LAEKSEDKEQASPGDRKVISACPHCGRQLSPWQQVLLTIDRALVCRNCWYRIILDISKVDENPPLSPKKE
jgi:DNA-directed RNA polymerase subunit RPC12/RpoP